jgi:hypothetical protein
MSCMVETAYIPGLRSFDTLKDVLDYAIEEATVIGTSKGVTQGSEQERIRIIQAMLGAGCDWIFIQRITQLSEAGYLDLIKKY